MSSPTNSSLTISDHTFIMEALVDRAFLLALEVQQTDGDDATALDIIDAALRVRSIAEPVKVRLRQIRELLPLIDAGRERLPAHFAQAMVELQNELSGLEVDAQLTVIDEARNRNGSGDELMRTALDSASEILRDGAATLYSPTSALNEIMDSGTTDSRLGDIAAIDAIGGALGGGIGLLAAGVGAAPGAAAGAAGASAGALTAAVITHILK